MRYDDASQAGSMAADTAPVARADVDALPAGSFGPATGNAITGSGTVSGAAGADTVADAPGTIVALQGAGGPASGSGGSFQATGQYGLLSMDAQGNFNYVRNAGTPDGVQDVFQYTLADRDGERSSTTLTINIGEVASADATMGVPGVVTLPPGVELSDIRVSGRDLIITMPDGSQMVIPGGAVFVPQLVIGDVQVPASNLAALLVSSEPRPAAGQLQSSGGNFAVDVPPLDPGVPLGDLLPPTELAFPLPIFEEVGDALDREPEAGVATALLDDDEQTNGIAGGVGDDPGGASASGFLPGSGGDGNLTWALLATGAPAGFSYVQAPNGSIQVFQNGNPNAVMTITVNAATGAYTVTQHSPLVHPAGADENNLLFPISYTVTDSDGDVATGTLTVNVDDDTPVARNDTDAVVQGQSGTDGNVLSGAGTTSGNAGADSTGADPMANNVVGIHPGTSGSFTAVTAAGVTVAGTFGTLLIKTDGSYVYTLTSRPDAGGTDVFTYRIVDGDGDLSTATLTITVPADIPPRGGNTLALLVDDEALPDGNNPSSPDEVDVGTLAFTAGSDPLTSFRFSTDLSGLGGGLTWVRVSDVLIEGRDGGNLIISLSLSAPASIAAGATGTVTVTATLHDNYDSHPGINLDDLQALGSVLVIASEADPADTATGTVTLGVSDDIPQQTAATESVNLDEDELPNGIGDGDGETTTASGSLAALVSVGADKPGTFSFDLTGVTLPALTSGGAAVSYAVVGGVLVAYTGADPNNAANHVFTVTLTSSGNYTVTLLKPIDHLPNSPANDDNQEITIDLSGAVRVTDFDGDSIRLDAGSFTITIEDDIPTASTAQVTGTVDEDGVPGGIAGGPGDVAGESAVATGSVAALFNSGADQPLTYSLLTNTSGLPALTSGGVAVTYSVVGNTLTASAGGNTVFTFVLNTDGSWTFTLLDQLDHPTLNGLPGDNTENDLTIALGSIIQATDADGDTVTASANGLVITVDDDTPTASQNQVTGTVDEDGVPGGIAGGPGDVAGESAVATGSVAALFNSGADAPLTYSLLTNTSGLPALTSGGVAVTYSVVGNTLTASAGGNTVFTFVLNADGNWTFTLLDQLDHPTLNGLPGDNTENDLTIALGSIIQATDADGDSVTANANGLVITVDDDTPTASAAQVTGTVDEDGLPGGIAGGPGDVAGESTVATGSVATLFNSGADQPLTYSLLTNTSGLPALTSGGVAVTYAVVGNTLTASAGGSTVFTFVLNANGSWTFTLLDQLDHPTLNGLAGDNTENDLAIDLSSIVQATDADGDSVTANAGGLVITVDDDTPTNNAAVVTLQIDEDGLAGGNPGGPGDGPGTTTASASLIGLFNPGADQPITLSMSTDTSGLPALTSNGVAVTYSVVGNTLTASAGGNTVFTLVLNPATGNVTFTLVDQLDHPTLNGLAGDNTENNLILDFSSIFQGTDADGDTISLDAGSFLVDVDDDTPVAIAGQVTGVVDEDGLSGGNPGGPGDVAGTATVATGSVATLFSAGADAPLTYSLATNASGLPALTSGGVAVTYSVVGNTLTASAGANTVFTFVLNADGNWTFTLLDQIDHPTLNGVAGDDTENDLLIDLSSIIQATDADGDTVTASANGLVITVDDDTPIAANDTDTVGAPGTTATGNVITDAAPGDAGDTDSGADSVGADQPGSIIALVSNNAPGSTDTDPNPGIFSIAGQYGVLVMDTNGNYTYTRNAGTPGGVTDVFTYTLQDYDGDKTTATLTITIADTAPVAGTASAKVDDDGLVGGNPGGPADDDANAGESPLSASEATWNGTLGGSGGDAPVQFLFSTTLNGTTASVGTETVTYSVSGAGPAGFGTMLTATVTGGARNGTVLFTVTITDTSTGAYTVQLLDNVLHPSLDGLAGDNTENNVSVVVNYQMRDADGDTSASPGQLTIDFDDDTPTATATQLTGTVDEDGVPGGIASGTGDVAGESTVATGNVSALFSAGADGPLTYSLSTNTSGLPALTSAGVAVTYSVVGNTLTASAGGNTVFTFTLNASTGAYQFTLVDQLDHPTLNGLPGDNTENDLTIALGSIIQATDADGDTVTAAANGLVITVDDDTPTASTAQVTAAVDEEGLSGGIAGGPGDLAGTALVANGSVSTLFNAGADAPLTYSLSTNTSGLPALTSGGVAVTYAVVGNTLTASAGGNTVFTFVLNANGNWTFTLSDNLDHPITGTEDDIAIQLGSIIQATDADGDTVTANANGLVIIVDDDSPVLGTVQNQQTDNNPATAPAVGTLHFQPGADGPGSMMTITADVTGLKSGGFNLVTVQSGNVLTAYQDTNGDGIRQAGENVAVFTLTVNPTAGTSGQYVFDLITPLDPTITNTPIGGSSSFGAGPTLGQILEHTDGTDLSVVSGYLTNGTFNFNTWFTTGVLSSSTIAAAGVNGSVSGWGVGDNNFNNPNEIFFFDFGAQALSDPDGGGAFAPPATTLPNISFATFDFINYNGAAGNAGDDIAYVVHFTDGTFVSGFVPDSVLDGSSNNPATHWTFTAPAGKFIADIQFFSGANPDSSVQDLQPGKIDLVSVGVQSSTIDKTIPFTVQLTDGDGDPTATANFTVRVANSLTPAAPEPGSAQDPAFTSESSSLLASNDNVDQQKSLNSGTNTVLMGALAAAGLGIEPVAASTYKFHSESDPFASSALPETNDATAPAVGETTSAGVGQLEPDGAVEAQQGSSSADAATGGDQSLSSETTDAQQPAELLQGTESPSPAADSATAPATAHAIVVPSADQLLAAALTQPATVPEGSSVGASEGVYHNQIVSQVLVDALNGGGSGPDVDGLINSLPGTGEAVSALESLASHGSAGVSIGDMGLLAGFATAPGMHIVDLTMHQDAAPAQG